MGTVSLSGQQDWAAVSAIEKLNGEIEASLIPGKARTTSGKALAELLAERRRLLEEVMRWQPEAAMRVAFSPALAAQLLAAAQSADVEEYGEWDGVAETVVVADDFENDRASSSVFVRMGEEVLQVYPSQILPRIHNGSTRVSVRGFRLGKLATGEVRPLDRGAVEDHAPCSTTGEQRLVVIPVEGPGTTLLRGMTQRAEVFFSEEAPSLASHWREASYGKAWITGKMIEPVKLTRFYNSDELNQMTADALEAARKQEDLRAYNRFVLIVSRQFYVLPAAGLGTLGCMETGPGELASIMWLPDGVSLDRRLDAALVIHEGGHNLGAMHAASRVFPGETLGRPGYAGLHREYGSPYSPLGSATLMHYSAQEKLRFGWIEPSEIVEIREEGTAVLGPLGRPGTHAKAAKVLRNERPGEWLWIEFRKREGVYEGSLPEAVENGAVISLQDEKTEVRLETNLLDFTPETPEHVLPWDRDWTLRSGRGWRDRYTPLRLEVSADGDQLRVEVFQDRACHGLATDLSIHDHGETAGEFRILAPEDCAWMAQSFADWLTLEGPFQGTGSGTIRYRVRAVEDRTNRGGAVVVSGLAHQVLQIHPVAGPSGAVVRPSEGEGRIAELEVDWNHPNGPEEIYAARISLGESPGAAGGCTLEYYRRYSAIRLLQDNGEWGPFSHAYLPNVTNRNCKILLVQPVYAQHDGPIRLRLRVQFTSRDPAEYGMFLSATDRSYNSLDWFRAGAWKGPGLGAPSLSDVAGLEQGGGPELWLQGKLRNPRGMDDTKWLRFVIVDRADLEHSCAVEIDAENNQVRLGWSPEEGWTPWNSGFLGVGMLANTRCRMGGVIWAGLEDPTEKWIGFGVRFLPAFAGKRQIYFQVTSRDGTEWDWTVLGEWEVRFP